MNDKGRLLLVEDEAGFRRVYQDLFDADGYNVLTAEDGEAGWAFTKQNKPDLVLLDLWLPKLDGFEVLRRIREDEETKKIPVLIFTVSGEAEEITKALEMGADDYTVKGFYTPRQILGMVEGLLDASQGR
jgi:DNA-binding response OmpR family regulator